MIAAQNNDLQALMDRFDALESSLGVGSQRSSRDIFGQGRGWKAAQDIREGEEEAGALNRWNPSGAWPNPLAPRFGGPNGYRPHEFIAALANDPSTKDYLNPEGVAGAQGAEGLAREGRNAKTDSRRRAKAQGLGRGFAASADAEIDTATRTAGAEMMTAAHLEGVQRRFGLAAEMARSLAGANEARFSDYLAEKSASAAEDAGDGAMAGGILAGIGALAAAFI